ncbi:hypothetical protein PIB30_032219 [Stylosanthes scabra]|uniref:Ribonuclease H1 N-terminal domain-containing protein n=1 Tax=Stylosanthes scabra TaxID=79078 RepID=A0ABU6TBU5_9FABA|nr:hypothetical protein [Stylosanthes scabra]
MEGANNVRYWCVFNGWVPGVYTTEEDMRFQIDGFEGPSGKSVDSIEAAEDAWIVYFGQGSRDVGRCRLQSGDAPSMFQLVERRERERMAIIALRTTFAEEKKRFSENPQGRQCVPPRAQPPLLVTVSIRGLLQDACTKLDMPAPIYRGMMCTSPDGRQRFRDIISLVLPAGRRLPEPDCASFSVATTPPSTTTTTPIVQRWKEKYVQLCQELATLEATVRLLTTSADAPRSQVLATDMPATATSTAGATPATSSNIVPSGA